MTLENLLRIRQLHAEPPDKHEFNHFEFNSPQLAALCRTGLIRTGGRMNSTLQGHTPLLAAG